MRLKTLMIGAGALTAFAALSAVAWAQDPAPGTEIRKEIRIEEDGAGHGGHCHMIMMHVGGAEGMKAMHEAMAAHGGVITREEFVDAHAKLFDSFDSNHDGKLDAAEIEAAHHHMMESHDGDCAADMHVMHDHDDMDAHHGEHMEIRMVHGAHDFDKMDANHDGRISFEEFVAPLREAFDAMDKDHSGYIEKAEWPHGDGHGEHMEIHREIHEDKQ
jgi:Ca2+-binding EF-hand superfamily protein